MLSGGKESVLARFNSRGNSGIQNGFVIDSCCGLPPIVNMATFMEPRLAFVTARDGVDTRKKELTVACNEKQERDGQTAALYMAPPGAEVVGSPMHAYWSNYRRLADAYVNGEEDRFMWVSYETQQAYNEAAIERDIPTTEGILHLYRMWYNRYITEFRRTLDSNDLEDALEYLACFNKEKAEQESAVLVLQRWARSLVPRCRCGARSMFPSGGLCVDCHWTEDGHIKKMRQMNALTPR